MAYCIENKKKHRCNKLSLHILDIIQSIMLAARKKKKVNIKSCSLIPKRFTSIEIKKIIKY